VSTLFTLINRPETLVAVHLGGFAMTGAMLRRIRKLPASDAGAGPDSLAVLVNLRNDEARIPALLASLRLQRHTNFRVYAWVDCSTDRTLEVARRHARDWKQLTVIEASSPPQGWCAKTWGQCRLAEIATEEHLLFVDSDVRFSTPDALDRITSALRECELFLGVPRLTGAGLAALAPGYQFLLTVLTPLGWGAYPHVWGLTRKRFRPRPEWKFFYDDAFLGRSDAIASRPALYSLRSEAEVRNYESLPAALEGLTRNVARLCGPWGTPVFLTLILICFVLPFLLLSWPAIALLLLNRRLSDRAHGLSFAWTCTAPLGALLLAWAFYRSWIRALLTSAEETLRPSGDTGVQSP
jgi:hypothetical protein